MQIDTINKFKLIFEKFSNLPKEKEVNIWEIGTDFLLNIRRFNYLIDEILLNNKINDISGIESLVITPEVIDQNESGNDRLAIRVELIKNGFEGEEISYYTSIKNLEKFKKINKFDINDLFAWSTYRQLLETWCSVGYISPQTSFAIGKPLDVANIDREFKDDEAILRLILDSSKNAWNNISLKSNSIRDIVYTIVFTKYFIPKNKVDYNTLKECLGDNTISFRTKNQNRNFIEIFDAFSKSNSSIKKQSWHNKEISLKSEMILEEMLNFIYEKAKNDWIVDDLSSEYIHLMYYSRAQGRSGQGIYKVAMSNSIKRFTNSYKYELHDILDGVKSMKLVEAAHILDYRFCGENEKFDPDNGLLIDPSLHKWFDKDLITFDTEGHMLIEKKYYDEIKMILKDSVEYKIRDKVLSSKTKQYILKRNELHAIDLKNFITHK